MGVISLPREQQPDEYENLYSETTRFGNGRWRPRFSLEIFVFMPQDECVERLLKYVCSAGAIDESVWIPDKPLPQGTRKNFDQVFVVKFALFLQPSGVGAVELESNSAGETVMSVPSNMFGSFFCSAIPLL
jgi:hypothetical protein